METRLTREQVAELVAMVRELRGRVDALEREREEYAYMNKVYRSQFLTAYEVLEREGLTGSYRSMSAEPFTVIA